jgi:hypothetical protein
MYRLVAMLNRVRSALSALEWKIMLTVLIVLAALAQPGSAESQRAIELAESIAVDHSLRLDGVVVRDGFVAPPVSADGTFPPPVGEAHDRSFFAGHYYLGTAPGLSILMLPAAAVLEPLGARAAPAAWRSRFVRHGVITLASVFTVMIPVSLLTLLFVHRTHTKLLGDGREATLLTFLYAFGTLFFHSSVQPNVWQIVNSVTWAFVYFAVLRDGPLGNGLAIALGLGTALAVSMNYFAGILLPLFGVTLLLRKDLRSAILLGAGFALGVLPLLAYHQATFGGPLSSPYSHRIDKDLQVLMASGWQGFFVPSPVIAFKLLFHPYIGLFFYAPITIFALFGVRYVRGNRLLGFALAGALLFLVLVAARTADYHSGQGGFGSRYIVPMVPFAWLLVVGAYRHVSLRLFEGVAIVSVFVSLVGAMFGGKFLHLGISQLLIRGFEIPSLGWLKRVLDEMSERRPPVGASGVLVLVALGLWLVWRRRPLLGPTPTEAE